MPANKGLVIVESPAKARTISKYLKNEYKVEASVGHIIDLPQNKIGVDFDNDFNPEYVQMPGKTKVISNLKKAAKSAPAVFLATDPDREGEAIAWHIQNAISNVNTNVHRVEFNEITKKAVAEAMADPREIDINRVDAQQARRVLDRIVGYKVSPLLWKTLYKGLSAGRVQSVALRLVCEREAEIRAFKPEEYWNVHGHFLTHSNESLKTKLSKIDGKKAKIQNAEEAGKIKAEIEKQAFTIDDISKRKTKRSAFPPFTTSTLQQVASRQLGMSSKKTMMVAQQLYEGIDTGGETIGLITYMRTDSLRVSGDAIAAARKLIHSTHGEDFLPEKPNYYKTKKNAQDAHEAIRPTQIRSEFSPGAIGKYLNNDQKRLYGLIWRRFISSQMTPAIIEKTKVSVLGGAYLFQAEGEVVRFKGFLQEFDDKEENGNDGGPVNLPATMATGESVRIDKIDPEQKFTQPPARFTESSLVKILDQLNIGRPSTYAQIISTIIQRKYIEITEKKLHATELGMTVNKILLQFFPNIFNVEFTAFMEEELDKIANGNLGYTAALHDFYTPFSEALDKAQEERQNIKNAIQEDAGVECDKCGRPMLIKWSKNGRFLACSGFPDCRNTKPLVENEPKMTDHDCPTCGKKMAQKEGRYGQYLACSDYPNCKTTTPVPTGVSCPLDGCDGHIVQKQSRRGKVFFGCSNYPKCDFATWNKPMPVQCPNCGNAYLEEKNTKQKGLHYQCPSCKHKFAPDELANDPIQS
jgi:DNA topoisomerase-1